MCFSAGMTNTAILCAGLQVCVCVGASLAFRKDCAGRGAETKPFPLSLKDHFTQVWLRKDELSGNKRKGLLKCFAGEFLKCN